MRSTLSRLTITAQETWATMPFSKVRMAAAQSSVPSALSLAVPLTLTGSAKGLPHGRAGDEAGHRDRIAADIENAATGQIGGKEAVLGLELAHGEAKARLDHAHLADGAGADQLAELGGLRVQAIHEGLAGKSAGLAVGMEDRVDLEGRKREGLFDQHMLAGLGCLDCPFGVAGVGDGDIDGIDFGIGQQSVIAVHDARAREILGQARPVGRRGWQWRPARHAWSQRRRPGKPWRCCQVR